MKINTGILVENKPVKYDVRLTEVLSNKGVSGYKLAQGTGISPRTIYDLINGKTPNPEFYTLLKICFYLQVEISEIIAFNHNK